MPEAPDQYTHPKQQQDKEKNSKKYLNSIEREDMDHYTPSPSSGRKKDLGVKITAQMRKTLVTRSVSHSSHDSSSVTSPSSSSLLSPAYQSRDFTDALHTPSPSTPVGHCALPSSGVSLSRIRPLMLLV